MGARVMTRAGAAWIEGMQGRAVLEVAKALGVPTQPRRGSSGGELVCPSCRAERRHTKAGDRRLSAGVRNDGRGWRCFQCDASGDALDLVAYSMGDERLRDLPDHRRSDVRAWCESFLGLPSSTPGASVPRPKIIAAPKREPEPPTPPRYPPEAEVSALWAGCVPVTEDAEVSAYLNGRGIDPVAVADLDVARALVATDAALPSWAVFGRRSWLGAGGRLIVPLVDELGAVRSVLARRLGDAQPKSLATKGYERRGLIMACPVARQILERGALPSWWAEDAPPLRVIVAEGEADFMLNAAGPEVGVRWGDADPYAPAHLGMFDGGWTRELAARLPDGCRVVIATDTDPPKDDGRPGQGDQYAAKIVGTLAERVRGGRIEVKRWRPKA